MCTYNWSTLLYTRNWHISWRQLHILYIYNFWIFREFLSVSDNLKFLRNAYIWVIAYCFFACNIAYFFSLHSHIFCLNGFYIRFWDGCFLTKAKPIYGWSLILRWFITLDSLYFRLFCFWSILIWMSPF